MFYLFNTWKLLDISIIFVFFLFIIYFQCIVHFVVLTTSGYRFLPKNIQKKNRVHFFCFHHYVLNRMWHWTICNSFFLFHLFSFLYFLALFYSSIYYLDPNSRVTQRKPCTGRTKFFFYTKHESWNDFYISYFW